MTELNFEQAGYAIYTPAIQPWYSLFPYQQDPAKFGERVKGKLALSDLDILAPNPLCQISYALYSAGLALENEHLECCVSQRDRTNTLAVADSGGFQVNSGGLGELNSVLRLRILRWMEGMCDVGHNLDVPLKALDNPSKSGYRTFDQCLDTTLVGLKYFCDKRQSTSLRLLNVLQGRDQDQEEADRWYEAVREFPLEGWAFAGIRKTDFYYVCKRLLQMTDRGEINADTHLHFLGVGTPEIAIVLTALKRALRQAGFSGLQVTFDTSTPFIDGGKFKKAATGLRFGPDKMSVHRHHMPFTPEECMRAAQFPFDSPIGRRLLLGDMMPGTVRGEVAWDLPGWVMLTNHNVYAETAAIIRANQVMDLQFRLQGTIPHHVREAATAVWKIFTTGKPGKYLEKHKQALRSFVKVAPDPDDDDATR